MSREARRIVLDSRAGPEVTIGGKRYLYFGGTDYLGMAGLAEVGRGAAEALERFGVSASAARTSSGTLQLHLDLERRIADFAGSETAVIYSSGYLGTAVLLSGLLEEGDAVFVHRDAHSSIMEGARAWTGSYREFDLDNLSTLSEGLKSISVAARVIVIGEGVSPLFGRIFPLNDVEEILAGREYLVLLDDAHGFGVLGPGGRGTASHWNRESEKVITCATLSKAFGSFGGVIPTSQARAGTIQRNSTVYQCSTPIPAPICGAALAALAYLESHPGLLDSVKANNRLLRDGLRQLGLDFPESPAPIIPLIECGKCTPRELSDHLFAAGILAPFSMYPGSPQDGMVRLIVTAGHSAEQIGRLVEETGKVV